MSADLYATYHIDRDDERAKLFAVVAGEYHPSNGLYPGCFVHVTPSFYVERMVYVDSDLRAERFFDSGEALQLVAQRKEYQGNAEITFYRQDYTKPLKLQEGTIDLLISQYAGFISEHCKRYLRSGGILIANNSHGDAGLAACDPDFELAGVIHRRGERFRLSHDELSEYFIPKSNRLPTDRDELRKYIKELGRGIGYTKTATDYLFRRR